MGKTTKKKGKDRASKQFMIGIWIALAIVAIVIFFSLRSQKEKLKIRSAGNVSSVQAPQERSKGYSGPSSPQFNQDLIQKGKQDAQEARETGKSFVAPMTNGENQAPKDQFNLLKKAKRFEKKATIEKLEPKPLTTVKKPKRSTPEREVQAPGTVQVDQKRAEEIRKSLQAQLAMISNKMVYSGHAVMEYKPVEQVPADTNPVASTASADPAKDTPFNMVRDLGIRPGDVAYASNMQTLNTDTPAPVATVEILSGPMKYCVAEGTFELVSDKIRFTFYRLTDKDGQKYDMKGFAVDPATKFAGVASEVDHHTLSRWSGIVASSLLSGWAEAVTLSGTSSSTNVAAGIINQSNPEYSLKDKFWIASGEVADKLSDAAKANFNRAATAWLKSGYPVGVLIIDIKPVK